MTDEEAETTFRKIRWAETDGAPVCPSCGSLDAYDCRRPNGAPRFRCRGCKKDFTITVGTLFASHKLPLRAYLAAIAIFCNEVKGKSMLAMSRDLGLSYKSAFVLLHKLREAMAEEMRGRVVGGEGKMAEIDGGYFGGYVKPANLQRGSQRPSPAAQPIRQAQGGGDRARARRQLCPGSVPHRKAQPLSFDHASHRQGHRRACRRSRRMERLARRFEMKRINHQEAYSLDGACTNQAEEYFSRLRRAEIGHPSPYRRRVSAPLRSGSRHGAKTIAASRMAIR